MEHIFLDMHNKWNWSTSILKYKTKFINIYNQLIYINFKKLLYGYSYIFLMVCSCVVCQSHQHTSQALENKDMLENNWF